METEFAFLLLTLFVSIRPYLEAVPVSDDHQGDPVVTTSYGQVQGMTSKLDSTTFIDVFRSIPYAKPLVGMYVLFI